MASDTAAALQDLDLGVPTTDAAAQSPTKEATEEEAKAEPEAKESLVEKDEAIKKLVNLKHLGGASEDKEEEQDDQKKVYIKPTGVGATPGTGFIPLAATPAPA